LVPASDLEVNKVGGVIDSVEGLTEVVAICVGQMRGVVGFICVDDPDTASLVEVEVQTVED
jgi:hypothetical protein